MLLKRFPLMFAVACAQHNPSIEDMLADTSNTMHTPEPTPTQETGPSGLASPMTAGSSIGSSLGSRHGAPSGSSIGSSFKSTHGSSTGSPPSAAPMPAAAMGGLLGAIQGSTGSKQQKPDMFGNKPKGPMGALGGLFGGGGAGAKANPIMDDLLKSVESRMPMNKKLAEKKNGAPATAISEESRQIVSGIVEKFMHKVRLTPGEKQCLESNLATLTADIVGTVEDVVDGVKAIIASKSQAIDHAEKAKKQGTLVSSALDGGMKLTSLVTLATTIMKNCVRGDALELIKETGRHFIDMQYIGHRLLVSGVDIAHRLSDGIIAFEHNDWHRFGEDIGISLRKIVLSNSSRGSRLPEGVPEEAIIQQTTEGLMSGFFRRGSGVEITDSAAPNVDIQLDLHRCITGNHEFFKEIWLALWNMMAEFSMSISEDGKDFQNPFDNNADGSQPKWMGEFMVAMMQIPMALSRCNIDEETQQMLMTAIKSLKYLKVHFIFPTHVITAEEATQRMAKAVEAWTNWDFKGFGKQIGMLLQEFVLLMYPQQYSVDSTGRLRRQLDSPSTGNVKVGGLTLSTSVATSMIGGVALSMLLVLVAVRGLRSASRKYEDASSTSASGAPDSELGGSFLEVECLE